MVSGYEACLTDQRGASGVVVSTEGWEPNLAVARDRLEPYGVEVRRYDAEKGEPLPFDDNGVDYVMSRHEGIDAVQVARIEDLPIQVSQRRFRINATKL